MRWEGGGSSQVRSVVLWRSVKSVHAGAAAGLGGETAKARQGKRATNRVAAETGESRMELLID